ncbi:DUF5706 domain-containing protein [Pedobacter gandavensis]|uniref:Pycsar system effector family protein n=1 Tax=Pedobacter gandavensis TaxID=2679963 RepID=UPI0024788D41|nr:Pycsar system effector family protein [Pedobacter gandavensis]WGQ09019.1 DUF5706 domain-containing protein [Pedobacter gandavensis]
MERERLTFNIGRFDHYYDSVNNKSAVFLGLSTFIVGGLAAAYPAILDLVTCGVIVHLMMISVLGLGIAIMIIVVLASTPFLGKETDSMYYFGSIASMAHDDYCNKSSSGLTEEDELSDLRKQSHQLSCGLNKKFRKLQFAGKLFTIQFFLFIPLILIIITNLK